VKYQLCVVMYNRRSKQVNSATDAFVSSCTSVACCSRCSDQIPLMRVHVCESIPVYCVYCVL
jgi:hypothetical protein